MNDTGERTQDPEGRKLAQSNSKSEDTEQYGRWRIHAKSVCSGYCPFHNPSNHPLKDAGINIRGDKMMLVERMCEHGIGHDDPDSVAYLQSKGEMWAGTHGCDGCCCEPPQDSPLGQVTSLTKITAEYFMATDPDRVALQRKVLAWHKAEIAKLFEQIRSEVDDLLSKIEGDNNPNESTLGHFKDAQDGKRSMSALLQVLLANEYYRLGEVYVIKEVREALTRIESK